MKIAFSQLKVSNVFGMTDENDLIWQALIVENFNASRMIQDGLRRLSQINVDDMLGLKPVEYISPLYLGLLDYTAGLERLAKITLSVSSRLHEDSFGSIRSYSHRITDLLRAVEKIELPNDSTFSIPARPTINQQEALLTLMDKFSSGAGRYENIDFLTNTENPPKLYETWCKIAQQEDIPDYVVELINLRSVVATTTIEVITSLEESGPKRLPFDLETVVLNWIDSEDEHPVFAPSAAVVVQLATLSRWVAEAQSAVTNSLFEIKPAIASEIPVLQDATSLLRITTESFFEHIVMNYNDAEVLTEVVQEYLTGRDCEV